MLTTILVATTACTIYSAALFTNLAMELLGPRGVRACLREGKGKGREGGCFPYIQHPPPKKIHKQKKQTPIPSFESPPILYKQVAYSTVALTVITLVFGELIPKSLGVSNAEMVARIMVSAAVLLESVIQGAVAAACVSHLMIPPLPFFLPLQ